MGILVNQAAGDRQLFAIYAHACPVVRIVQRIRKKLMSRLADSKQIDLRFSDQARGLPEFPGWRSPPAISRASASTCSDNTGSEQTGKLNPCRRALRAARARPYRVRGPVLAREFARLTLILSSLVKPQLSFRGRRLNDLELVVFDLLHAPSQRFGKNRPTAIDLAQAGIAAALGDGGQVVDPLDLIEVARQCFGHEIVDALAGADEKLVNQCDGVGFMANVISDELFELAVPRTFPHVFQQVHRECRRPRR